MFSELVIERKLDVISNIGILKEIPRRIWKTIWVLFFASHCKSDLIFFVLLFFVPTWALMGLFVFTQVGLFTYIMLDQAVLFFRCQNSTENMNERIGR